MRRKLKLTAVLLCLVYLIITNTVDPSIKNSPHDGYAKEDDFTKAVWVSTVFGLDYPKQASTNYKVLKSGIDEIIKNSKEMGFNTIFFQVRPASDSLYKSDIFPWSRYLTGNAGDKPTQDFDPLEYIISEAHKNNIKIHAWINPYRITASKGETNLLSENSPALLNPDWVIDFEGKLYFNPGLPEVNNFVVEGAVEIAKNYDIDGVQIDDYFYPGEDFPDDWSYSVYGKDFENIDDWRRENINSLIEKMSSEIKKANPKALFGVSPRGIWANAENLEGGSNTSGKESYFFDYADTRKWIKENKIDYIIPQIYWNIGYAGADFKTLLNWWSETVKGTDVKLIIGQAAYKVSEASDSVSIWYKDKGAKEIEKQIILMKNTENVSGYSMFRYSSLLDSPQLKAKVTSLNTGKVIPFWDLDRYPWAKDDIVFLYEKGIINGMSEGVFSPETNVTRGQFAVMISRLFEKQAEFTDNFSDVSPDKYYYNHIGTLKALGLIHGKDENIFDPDGNISRQDMATMVYRILDKENVLNNTSSVNISFSDAEEIKDYAFEAVAYMSENNLLTGYEDNTFKPSGNATRAECSVFLSRILKHISK